MTARWKKLAAAGALAVMAALLPGCWDYQRIDKRAMMLGVAVDPAKGGKYEVTIQLSGMSSVISGNPELGGGGGGGGGETGGQANVLNVTETADTFEQAAMLIQNHLDRNLFYGNLQTVIFSEQLPKDQLKDVVLELERNDRIPKICVVVFTPNKAEEILKAKAIRDEPTSFYLNKAIRDIDRKGYNAYGLFWAFIRDRYGLGIDPYLNRVKMEGEKIVAEGTYIFHGYNAVGPLDNEETRGLNWLKGNIYNIPFLVGTGPDAFLIDCRKVGTRLGWSKEGDHYLLKANIKVTAVLEHQKYSEDRATPGIMRRDEEKAAAAIEEEIRATFTKLQKWKSDPTGFGRRILLHDPRGFRVQGLEKDWPDVYARSRLQVRVDVHLISKGELL